MLRPFIRWQTKLSDAFDKLLPEEYRLDGNTHFVREFVNPYLSSGKVIYDVGGGGSPLISADLKKRLQLRVVGLDVDPRQLQFAPEGAYDETICANVTTYKGKKDADIVICQAVLEHVEDTHAAIRAICSILKPGGVALIFVPSRNALYSRLNLILPDSLKRALLYYVYPHTRERQGFRAYYNRCTPHDIRKLAELSGMTVENQKLYYVSKYFSFFFPMYLIWRLWLIFFRTWLGDQAAETFSMALRKIAPANVLSLDGASEAERVSRGARSDRGLF
jgi:2-polyprenyl-6-hydroxyphenyl methylase/3-demethylubiquinone-9 3-methyltransferase